MSSERIAAAFGDIIQAVGLIETWVKEAGGQEAALAPDTQSRSAIERQLPIISEAALRLHKLDPELLKRLAPRIDWPGVRGVGNYIRHKYDDLDGAIIASAVGDKLAELRSACAAAIETLENRSDGRSIQEGAGAP